VIRNDTHEVCIDRDRGLVVKRLRSARRGEPVREWTALSLLDRLAPGLAPAPVSADLDSDFPAVTMSLLPGAELSAAPVMPAQARALAEALERLWRSVPSVGRELPAVTPNPVAFAHQVTAMQNRNICRIAILGRIRGEVQQPGWVAPGHDGMGAVCRIRLQRKLRDRVRRTRDCWRWAERDHG